MNLNKTWRQQKVLYDNCLRLFGPNSERTKRRWKELNETTNRIIRRDSRKRKAS